MNLSHMTLFDPAAALKTPAGARDYLRIAFETGDQATIQRALGTVARARGMAATARAAGVQREALYRALSEGGNPEFGTILKVAAALGFRLAPVPT